MLDPVNTSWSATAGHSSRFDQKPMAVLIAFAALAALALYAVRSLRNRVQPLSAARKLYDEGFSAKKEGNYPVAIAKYSLALKSNPDPLTRFLSLFDLAISYRALQQLDEALQYCTDALACECEETELRVKIHIIKGDIHTEKDDHSQAMQEYDSASKLDPLNPLIFFKKGCSKLVLEDFQGAVDDFTAADNPNSPDSDFQCEVLAYRGEAYMGLGNLMIAMKDFENAFKFNHKNADIRKQIHIRMGMIYGADEPLKAIQAYTLALECKPHTPDEHANLLLRRAAAKLAAEQLEGAIEDLEEARECNPADPNLRAEIRIQLGKIYQQQEKFDFAETELTEAINCHPTENQETIYFLRGQVRVGLRKFGMAIVDFTFATDLVPPKSAERAEFLLHRGWAQIENNNKAAAFLDWDESLSCDLENGLVKANLLYAKCEIHRRDKDYELVITNATAALKCEFDDKELERDLYRNRGGAYRMTTHLKEAIEDWSKALVFEFKYPDDKAGILYGRGMAHQKNGELYQARTDWQEALKYVTNEELRQRIQAQLDVEIKSLSTSVSFIFDWAWSKSPFSSPKK